MDSEYLRVLFLEDDFQCFKQYASINGLQLMNVIDKPTLLNDIIPLINAKVYGSREDRLKGLIILRKVLPFCTSDILSDHALSWIQLCCRWDSETTNEQLKVLCKTATLKLKCLRSVANLYGPSCGPYRNDFSKFVIYCLKNFADKKKVIREAALCFVAVCQCTGKGQHGANHKEMWSSQLKALIDTCHRLLDSIYGCVDYAGMRPVQLETDAAIPALLELYDDTDDDPLLRFHRWNVAFSVSSALLRYMFRAKYSVRKSFKPNEIFTLVCRALAVNPSTLKNCAPSNDVRCLEAILPNIHASTFDILRTLIRVTKGNLISYGTLICKLCLQTLKWTEPSNWKYATTKPFEFLRCRVLVVLSSWLSIASSSSSIEIFADELIPLLVSNIEFCKPEIEIMAAPKQNKPKKRKVDRNAIQHARSASSVMEDRIANKKVCVLAHRVLQLIIRSAHSLVKWEHHKTLQCTIMQLSWEVVRTDSSANRPLPYSDAGCRLQLFHTLYALVKWPHWKWKTPLSLSSRLFDTGRNDDDFQVSAFCVSVASELETLIHPRGPSLSVARPFADENEIRLAGKCFAAPLAPVLPHRSSTDKSESTTAKAVVVESLVCEGKSGHSPSATDIVPAGAVAPTSASAAHSTSPSKQPNSGGDDDLLEAAAESPLDSHTVRCLTPDPIAAENSHQPAPPASFSVVENSPSSKKQKIDNSTFEPVECDPSVAILLDDFVDTLQ